MEICACKELHQMFILKAAQVYNQIPFVERIAMYVDFRDLKASQTIKTSCYIIIMCFIQQNLITPEWVTILGTEICKRNV